MVVAVFCGIILGSCIGWLCLSLSINRELRRRTARELRSLEARLELVRRAAVIDGGGAGAVVGLVSWMKNHAAKISAKAGRQLEAARSLLADKPQDAAQIKREIEVGLAALDILDDFFRRYLEPMSVLQRQGAVQAFQEIGSWQQRLRQRIDRQSRACDLAEEHRQLELLVRYIDKELGETGPADAAVLLRRLTVQLRTLNEVESRLDSKIDGRRAAT